MYIKQTQLIFKLTYAPKFRDTFEDIFKSVKLFFCCPFLIILICIYFFTLGTVISNRAPLVPMIFLMRTLTLRPPSPRPLRLRSPPRSVCRGNRCAPPAVWR